MRALRHRPRFGHERIPETLEHFNDHKYGSSHNSYDREKNVQQINHWNVIKVVFHVSSFLSLSTQSLKSSAEGRHPCMRRRFLPGDGKTSRLPEIDDRSGLANLR